MKKNILIILAFFFALKGYSQTNHFFLKAGTQIPFQHNAGSEFVLNSRLGFQMQYGLLTAPYQGYISKVVSQFENDRKLIKLIDDSFQSGSILGLGFNYHFQKNYFGAFGQYISLRNASSASEALQAYYNFDFSFLNAITGPVDLTLQSNLYNLGLMYGRRFILKDPGLQMHLELGVSKNLTSKNNLQSNLAFIDRLGLAQNLYNRLDHSLRDIFSSHIVIPTINIYIVYDLMSR
ncbi:MAG: hypothetical protein M3512_11930 [Bacteroidota bacterium]|nr:hypothetical protein [Bacteroidota bacterium]